MIGLIASQIRITGDLEKDQQLLIYGIGGLIGLIVLAMIVILILVVMRRNKASRASAQATVEAVPVPQPEPVQPDPVPVPAQNLEPVPAEPQKPVEPPATQPQAPAGMPVAVQEQPETVAEEPKKETVHNAEDKMEEIRRRLEEIRSKKNTEPVPVLPKIEAAPRTEEPVAEAPPVADETPDPVVYEHEIHTIEEADETLVQEDISGPAPEEGPEPVTEPEGPTPETDAAEEMPGPEPRQKAESDHASKIVALETEDPHLPHGKYLPMKKLTFAEWVELFK